MSTYPAKIKKVNVSGLVNCQQCWLGSSLWPLVFKQGVSHKDVNWEGENKSLFSTFFFSSSFIFSFFVGPPLFLFFFTPGWPPSSDFSVSCLPPPLSVLSFPSLFVFLRLSSLKPPYASATLPLSPAPHAIAAFPCDLLALALKACPSSPGGEMCRATRRQSYFPLVVPSKK